MEPVTVILGASAQKERYAYLAFQTLRDRKIPFVLVNPRYSEIEGEPVLSGLDRVPGPVDTVSMYLSPAHQAGVEADLTALKPRRVIFNPGSENPELAVRLRAAGIACLEACTLVLLRTGQF